MVSLFKGKKKDPKKNEDRTPTPEEVAREKERQNEMLDNLQFGVRRTDRSATKVKPTPKN